MESPFLDRLARSRLLTPARLQQLRRAVEDAGLGEKSELLAEGLQRKEWLTGWQAEQLLAGRTAFFLGPYKLLDRIGSGGMGSVFQAEDSRSRRVVALKVLQQDRLERPGAAARFKREIQASSKLRHPHIVAALAADRIGSFYYLVMEYVRGRDLSRWLKERKVLPIRWSCECIRQAALGLEHIHSHGLVHRDIKPGNLLVVDPMVDGRPCVKIVDLGLVRFLKDEVDEELTDTGQILGTPDYIAPEQARDTHRVDIRADVFSLGCTLFRMLTGRWAFEGKAPLERLMARYTQDAPPLRSYRPEAPAGLERVLAKMLARDPGERFQTPKETAEALAPYALPTAVAGGTADSLDEATRALDRSATDASAEPAGGRISSIQLSSPGSTLGVHEAGAAGNAGPLQPAAALEGAAVGELSESGSQAGVAAPSGPSASYSASGSVSASGSGIETDAFLNLLSARPAAGEADPLEPAERPSPPGGGTSRNGSADEGPAPGGDVPTFDFSWGDLPDPDATPSAGMGSIRRWVWGGGVGAAILLLAGALLFMRPGTPQLGRVVLDWPLAERSGAALSLDGKRMRMGAVDEPVRLALTPGVHLLRAERPGFAPIDVEVDVDPRQESRPRLDWQELPPPIEQVAAEPLSETTGETVTAFAPERNGNAVLAAMSRGELSLCFPGEGRRADFHLASGTPYAVRLDRGGAWAAALAVESPSKGWIEIFSCEPPSAGARPAPVKFAPQKDFPLAFDWVSGKQPKLLVGLRSGKVELIGVHGRRTASPQDAHSGPVLAVAVSPGGDQAATAGPDGVALWELSPTLRRLGRLQTAPARPDDALTPLQPWRLGYSPDGTVLATLLGDRRLRLWNAADGTALAELPNPERNVLAFAFSPYGRFLALGGRDAVLQLWDWRSGAMIGLQPLEATGLTDLDWPPSGLWGRTVAGELLRWNWPFGGSTLTESEAGAPAAP